jgi:hypothetical protein
VFETKADTFWGFGHALLADDRMVLWERQSANKFTMATAAIRLKSEVDD